MNPILDELEKELGDIYKFAKFNVDEAREISIKDYGVTSVPTFIFIKDGVVKGKETGYMSKETITRKNYCYIHAIISASKIKKEPWIKTRALFA